MGKVVPYLESEVFTVDTSGPLDIRSGGDYVELYLDGQPLALVWSYNDGSVCDSLVRFDHPEGEMQLGRFRDALNDHDLETIIASLKPILAPGQYRVVEVNYYTHAACVPEVGEDIDSAFSFYGGDESLISTFPSGQLDMDRVALYRAVMREGILPWVVALCCHDDRLNKPESLAFVIDGHHKLRAYELEQIDIKVCLIVRLGCPRPIQPYPAKDAASRFNDYRPFDTRENPLGGLLTQYAVRVEAFCSYGSPQSGYVKCRLLDSSHREWELANKPDLVDDISTEIGFHWISGIIHCEVVREWIDDRGIQRCLIDTRTPQGWMSHEGVAQFEMFAQNVFSSSKGVDK